jgi:hypothetical protein
MSGSPVPFQSICENKVAETPLLKVFNLDKLNYNNDLKLEVMVF